MPELKRSHKKRNRPKSNGPGRGYHGRRPDHFGQKPAPIPPCERLFTICLVDSSGVVSRKQWRAVDLEQALIKAGNFFSAFYDLANMTLRAE